MRPQFNPTIPICVQPPRRRRRGFTLVELLVVIAIIGVLVALLLPAVQAAREAARRTSCLNNVTQLGLAVHSYEFHHEALPPGVTDSAGPIRNEPQGNHTSWVVHILPYIEQNPLWRRYDFEAGAYAPANADVRRARLAVLECPSSPDAFLNSADTAARTSYAGCHHDVEAPIDANNHGVLFLNSRIRYTDIDDGSSNTLLLGDAIVGGENLGWVSGARSTLRNTGALEQRRRSSVEEDADNASQQPSTFVGGFGSYHSGGGLNIALADGSTRFISDNIDPKIWRQLGNRADGEIMERF